MSILTWLLKNWKTTLLWATAAFSGVTVLYYSLFSLFWSDLWTFFSSPWDDITSLLATFVDNCASAISAVRVDSDVPWVNTLVYYTGINAFIQGLVSLVGVLVALVSAVVIGFVAFAVGWLIKLLIGKVVASWWSKLAKIASV